MGTLISALVDFASPAGQVDNVSEVDSGALPGIAVTAADTANGSWYYSTDNGTNWNALGAVASNSARLLAADATTRLYFQPNANDHGTLASGITFRAWDQTSGGNGTLADTTSNGGITAFSTATDTASLTVTAVNDAPVLDNAKSPTLSPIQQDAGVPFGAAGTLVSNLVDFALPAGQVDNFSDVDIGALLGIAVTAADAANGNWWYSTNNGSSWNALGAVATNNSRLLAADGNTRLYFQPNTNYHGTVATAITFRAWDQMSGGNGALADTTSNGGTTAFSAATDTASLTVNALNSTPVLDSSKSPLLTAQNEDSGAPSGAVGTLVSNLVDFASPAGQVDNVSDVDSGALLGIAVTAADTSSGTWWYSTDSGSSWNVLGTAASNNARLLAADANARLYFQPDANYSGTLASAITFRAWDQTSGGNGALADTNSNGGTTAFSTATDTASLTVTAVNDAPVLDNTKNPTLTAQNEDSARRPAPWGRWSRPSWISLHRRGRWTMLPTWTAGHSWASPSQRPTRPTGAGTTRPTAARTGTPWGRWPTTTPGCWRPMVIRGSASSPTPTTAARWPPRLSSAPGTRPAAPTARWPTPAATAPRRLSRRRRTRHRSWSTQSMTIPRSRATVAAPRRP